MSSTTIGIGMPIKPRGGRHGGAWSTRSTRPDAKPRGRPPDWRRTAEKLAAQIRRYTPGAAERETIRTIVTEALEELDKPIIM